MWHICLVAGFFCKATATATTAAATTTTHLDMF